MNDIRHKPWIALAVLVLFIVILTFSIIYPLFSMWLESNQQKSELVFKLHKQQSILAIQDAIGDNLEVVRKQFQSQNYFTSQENESLASAELQNIIKTAIAQNGGQLISTQGLPSENLNQFLKIIVSVRLSTNMESLSSVLVYLESNNPVMVIDNLDISPSRATRSNANLVNQNALLNVNFKISSFMRLKS